MRRRLLSCAVIVAALAAVLPPAQAVPSLRTAQIRRDTYGVPHVYADDDVSLAYAIGYVSATDRLFEMDVIRRLGQGRLSEILGRDVLEADLVMRREFYDRADIHRQTAALPDDVRALLAAYSDGVNRAMAEQLANPLETPIVFGALGYLPEPWTPEDSTSVLLLFTMVSFAGEGEGGELDNAVLLAELVEAHGAEEGLARWQDLLLSNDPGAEPVIDIGDGPPPPSTPLSAAEPASGQVDLALSTPSLDVAAAIDRDTFEAVKQALSGLPVPRIGSYAMAADGDRTASGGPLLLGAPQAGFTAPSTFYELGLHAPGVECGGFTVPGLGPFIGIGACNGHTWTLVAGNAGDQVDVYIEQLHPDDPHRYRFGGEWREMDVRSETYLVKSTTSGEPPEVVTQEVLSTIHGPVFHLDAEAGVAYVHRRSQAGFFAQGFEGTYALTFEEGYDAVLGGAERFAATYNLVYADDDGNIAYRFTGWQPVRAPGFDLRLPMPGTGEAEWLARALPADEMPHVRNPARGLINVNQGVDSKPISWWPRSSSIFVGRIGHTRSDKTFFGSEHDLDVARVQGLDRTLISDTDLLTRQFAAVVDDALSGVTDPDLVAAKAIWEDWRADGYPRLDADGDGRLDHPGVALFSADRLNFTKSPAWDRWMENVWERGYGRRLPGPYIGRLGMTLAAYESPSLYSVPLQHLVAPAFRDGLLAAIDELRGRFDGAPMETWTAPAPRTKFDAIGLVAPPPMEVVDHGTYSQVVDLGSGEAVSVLPAGNGRADRLLDVVNFTVDGSLPPHFADQVELYETFRHKPMFPHVTELGRPQDLVFVH